MQIADIAVPEVGECFWYHSMDLPGIGEVAGEWDLRGRFDEYVGRVPLQGRSVVDVGTASGFLSFEAEKRGGRVISFDVDSPERWQWVPPNKPNPSSFVKLRNGYTLAHQAFQSRATPIYGDIYQVSETVPMVDVVIIGQILVHLRDPLRALEQAASRARCSIVVAEGMLDTTEVASLR
jgi:hypothetical protein